MPESDHVEHDGSAYSWQDRLRVLREETTALVRAIPGPMAGVTVRAGECSLEVTWAATGTAQVVVAPGPQDNGVDAAAVEDGDLRPVTAPVVGTYYAAPAPGADPFVRVGDHVERGQNVAIVEAMKLMNHVTADWPGEVVEIPAVDGESVEFGQALVVIRTDDPVP